jgi:hypothetical protein
MPRTVAPSIVSKPNRSHQALTKQAKTRNFLKESPDRNSVLCLLMRREPSRSLHNLLHRPTNCFTVNRRSLSRPTVG